MKRIAVIGAGIGGLGVALRLAAKGHSVTVFEKNGVAGGKIGELQRSGYRFDTGPSLFTMPNFVEALFDLFDEPLEEYLPYQRLEETTRYFYEDGTVIHAFDQPGEFAAEIERKTNETKQSVLKFLQRSEKIYNITAEVFLYRSLHVLKNYFTKRYLSSMLRSPEIDAFTKMHKKNSSFFKDDRVVQLFDRYATYNGSNPYVAPATLNVIAHLEHNLGAFFPEEGMYSIIQSLVSLAERQGVAFRYNTKVEKVLLQDRRAVGVQIKGRAFSFDRIVSDVDIHTFYKHLLPDQRNRKKRSEDDLSSSALIFYWGMHKCFPELDLHNIFFSGNYKEEFHAIFEKKELFHDPTVYIFISSKKVPGDAPEGCENWYVMINVPPDSGQDWNRFILGARKNILDKVGRILNAQIEQYIDFEEIRAPKDLERETASWRGALYGKSSNKIMAAFNRHPNFSRKIKSLYFVGGSVHPGGGIPLCLSSAKIVADLISASS